MPIIERPILVFQERAELSDNNSVIVLVQGLAWNEINSEINQQDGWRSEVTNICMNIENFAKI